MFSNEQASRGSVIDCPVTNGFCPEWGAQDYADLQSIMAAAKPRGENVFAALIGLIVTPVLHSLEASSP